VVFNDTTGYISFIACPYANLFAWMNCSFCSEKCKACPICRNFIAERLPVYDV